MESENDASMGTDNKIEFMNTADFTFVKAKPASISLRPDSVIA
jgi:hypothetical protein